MPNAEMKAANDRQQLLSLASVVSQRVQISNVRLLRGSFHKDGVDNDVPRAICLTFNTRTELFREKSQLVVVFNGIVGVAEQDERDSEQKGNRELRIEATFALEYEVNSTDGIDNEHLEAFGRLNGLFNVWPYFREFVQTITSRMGLPPLTLPVQHPVKPMSKAIPLQDSRGDSGRATVKKARKRKKAVER